MLSDDLVLQTGCVNLSGYTPYMCCARWLLRHRVFFVVEIFGLRSICAVRFCMQMMLLDG
jgi:hypothetical protein